MNIFVFVSQRVRKPRFTIEGGGRRKIGSGFRVLATSLAAFMVISGEGSAAPDVVLQNFSFEAPALQAATFQGEPGNASWMFRNGAGIAANGSNYTSINEPAPDGVQVGFIQDKGVISQLVSGLKVGATYAITFSAAQRNFAGNPGQAWNVMVDDKVLQTFDPGAASTSYANYTTSFTAAKPSQTITFEGRSPRGGDVTVFIDRVRIEVAGAKAVTTDGARNAPSHLTAKAVSKSQVDLGWFDNSQNESGYAIERRDAPNGTYTQIARVPPDTIGYQDRAPGSATASYRVRTTFPGGESDYSEECSVLPPK